MSCLRVLTLIFCCCSVAACAGGGTPRPGTAAFYDAAFEGLEIRRIGNDTACNREVQNRALSQALDGLSAAGVSRDDIERLTISVAGCEQGGRALASNGGAYRVWVKLRGCGTSFLYRPGVGSADAIPCTGGAKTALRRPPRLSA